MVLEEMLQALELGLDKLPTQNKMQQELLAVEQEDPDALRAIF